MAQEIRQRRRRAVSRGWALLSPRRPFARRRHRCFMSESRHTCHSHRVRLRR